jgi:hypothetical protein
VKKLILPIVFTFLILSYTNIGACEPLLIHEEGSEVTYDSLSGRYWYYDLTEFTDMTYAEQIAKIGNLRVDGFPGSWHMATCEEMEELWFHSAEAIFASFALTRDDPEHFQQYADGRYDEPYPEPPPRHFFAEVRLRDGTTYEKSVLNYLDVYLDEDSTDVLGAWVVYEDNSSGGTVSPAAKILPATMLLLGMP